MGRSFAKMHGLGNDFVVFDATREPLNLAPDQLQLIADRRVGVGCDQILAAEPAIRPDADFFYRIYNADGSESGQCGNGARCLALFLRDQGLCAKQHIVVQTRTGLMRLEWLDDGQVRVEMGVPALQPAQVPLDMPNRQDSYELALSNGDSVRVHAVSIGNPHAVLTVDNVGTAPVGTLGCELEAHPAFPERANIGFMQIQDPQHIALRVYERGAGETRACGSGACAAMVAGRVYHGLAERIQVSLPGGILTVEWQGEGQPIYLTGDATHVFTGELI